MCFFLSVPVEGVILENKMKILLTYTSFTFVSIYTALLELVQMVPLFQFL